MVYEFELIVAGLTLDHLDAIYEATGGGGATVGIPRHAGDTGSMAFHDDAPTLTDAVASAVRQAESVPGLTVVGLEVSWSEGLMSDADIETLRVVDGALHLHAHLIDHPEDRAPILGLLDR